MATATPTLYELTVSEMARAVAKGEVTPMDLVESSLARIAALEPQVHAWSYMDVAAVRAQAAVLTAEAAAGKLRGPLHGVPVGIKDQFHVKGMPTRMRLRPPSTMPEPQDATPVARLRAAGAVIMGKTYMPLTGAMPPTRNPWNLEHTPGGTSSGCGAAVAARMVPVALGEQTIGSNLRPAAYCGVEGLKATFGRISRYGCYPISWSFDHPGIIGLTMEDIALVLSVIAGPDPLDPATLVEPAPPADLKMTALRPPRIGMVSNFFPERTEPVMQEAIGIAGERLRAAGAQVVSIPLPDQFGLMWHVRRLVGLVEEATVRAGIQSESRGKSAVYILVPGAYYLQAQRIRRWLYKKVQEVFKDVDVLLMGVAPGSAPKGLGTTGDPSLLAPWSCLGYPAITLNGGLSPTGLPLGLQFVGAPMKDFELLQVGAWCERVLGRLPAPRIS